MEELNSGLPKTNPSSGRVEDLNPGPLDYKSSALPLGHARLPTIGPEETNSPNEIESEHAEFKTLAIINIYNLKAQTRSLNY